MRSGTVTIRRPRVRGLEQQRFESELLPLFQAAHARSQRPVAGVVPARAGAGRLLSGAAGAARHAPLSASTVARLKERWEVEAAEWQRRSMAEQEVVYLWVDGPSWNYVVVYQYECYRSLIPSLCTQLTSVMFGCTVQIIMQEAIV